MRIGSAAPVLLLAALWGCSADLSVPPGARIQCEAEGQCPPTYVCRASIHFCVRAEGASNAPPGLVSGEVSPGVAGPASTVVARFTVDKDLFAEPTVSLGVPGRPPFVLRTSAGRTYEFEYVPPRGTLEAPTPVLVSMVDVEGNEAADLTIGTVTFDFTPPVLTDFSAAPLYVRATASATVALRVSEPTAAKVTLAGGALLQALPDDGSGASRFTYTATGAEDAGPTAVEVTVTDGAGNSAARTFPGAVVFDFTAPFLEGAPAIPHRRVRLGGVAAVTFVTSESLGPAPTVDMTPVDGGAPRHMVLNERLANLYTFTSEVVAGDPDGTYALTLIGYSDPAGNVGHGGTPELLGNLELDNQPPGATATITPATVKDGDGFTVDVTLTEPTATMPQVWVGAASIPLCAVSTGFPSCPGGTSFCVQDPVTATHWVCSHVARASEGDGPKSIAMKVTDEAGNTDTASLGTVTYDVSPPLAVAANLVRTPFFAPAVNATTETVLFTNEDPFTHEALTADLYVFSQEDLDASAAPVLTTTPPGLAFSLLSVTGKVALFRHALTGADPQGSYAFAVTWSDLAGNRGTRALSPKLVIDRSRPVLSVVQNQVTFVRSPWGNAASENLGAFSVPAGPYFAMAPANPLSGVATIPANTFTLDGGVPAAVVRAWGDAAATVPLGDARPDVANAGAWPRWRLYDNDRRAVHVTALDSAGNESRPVKIEHTEWVASPNPPASDPSPHRLELTGYATRTLELDPIGTTKAGAGAEGTNTQALLAQADLAWRQRTLRNRRPLPRSVHALAYDSARGRVVLFGGEDPVLKDDVWEWDGTGWDGPFAPGVAGFSRPSARRSPALVYDSARGRVVLFGGDAGGTTRFDDVWEWDGATRTWAGPFVPTVRPSARTKHALAYDSERGRVVLFGGDAGAFRDDVWEWDGATRTWAGPFVPGAAGVGRPSARSDHALAYDSKMGRVLLFGGNKSGGGLQDDVWEWNGAARTWAGPFAPGSAGVDRPAVRYGHSLAYDSARGRAVLFGGTDFSSTKGDLWEWDGAARTWAGPLTPGAAGVTRPSARYWQGLAYDSVRGRVVLFGGIDAATRQSDLWEWDGTAWAGPLPSTSTAWPIRRDSHAVAYDSSRQRTVVVGGYNGFSANFDEVWEWNGASGTWAGPFAPGDAGIDRPTARSRHALAYDSSRGRTVMFGGYELSTPQGDVWEWDGDGGVWAGPFVPGATAGVDRPSARSGHALAYDSARSRVVLFGGIDPARKDDVWEWNGATGTWAGPFAPGAPGVGRPSARSGHALAYDSDRDRVVLFGGYDGTTRDDVWEWAGATGTWAGPFAPGDAGVSWPSARSDHSLAYDSARRRVVLFGGSGGGLQSDVWEWDGATGTWAGPLTPGTIPGVDRPSARYRQGIAYDSARNRTVLFSGLGAGVPDVWEWDGAPARQPAIQFGAFHATARFDRPAVTGLVARAHCGGLFSPYTATGASLLGWNTGALGLGAGAWVALASNAVGVPMPAPNGALLQWTAASPAEAQAYVLAGESRLTFQCRPGGVSGAGVAKVALDYLEVRVRYDARLCGDGFLDTNEACDDGNTSAGDGCGPACAVE